MRSIRGWSDRLSGATPDASVTRRYRHEHGARSVAVRPRVNRDPPDAARHHRSVRGRSPLLDVERAAGAGLFQQRSRGRVRDPREHDAFRRERIWRALLRADSWWRDQHGTFLLRASRLQRTDRALGGAGDERDADFQYRQSRHDDRSALGFFLDRGDVYLLGRDRAQPAVLMALAGDRSAHRARFSVQIY